MDDVKLSTGLSARWTSRSRNLCSPKTIPTQPAWTIGDSEWLTLTSPLDVDGVTVTGFQLRATAMLRRPDVDVMFQLEHHPFAEAGGPVCRIEWNPIRGHTNKGCGPKELWYQEIKTSHCHPFAMNWQHSEKLVRQGILPIAIPLHPNPPNFRELLAIVGKEFRISNIQCVDVPNWQPQLL